MKLDKVSQAIIIYETPSKGVELRLKDETLWLSQKSISEIFDTSVDNVGLHLKNVYKEKELDQKSTTEDSSVVQIEGSRHIKRAVKLYNLDAIIAVGYRVNSKKATHFRQWATKVIKNHLVKGFTINRKHIKENYNQFLKAVEDVKKILPSGFAIDKDSVLELITLFADTWLSLDAYDKDKLITQGVTRKKVKLTAEKLGNALTELKYALIEKGEASDIFGVERTKGSVAGIVGNVWQSFDDQDLYPSVEEKAAHLLYFIIKNHPFVDGNKRSGAYAFVWFLQQAKVLDVTKITPAALTALTLLIAESSPKDKEKMVGLVCALLAKNKVKLQDGEL